MSQFSGTGIRNPVMAGDHFQSRWMTDLRTRISSSHKVILTAIQGIRPASSTGLQLPRILRNMMFSCEY
ncbi:Uncharacterized protein HZ326_1139 [Fusarium oxysporum f. sp. albedinis]|nr:Uncharacterized protein HZ326_1139 [Fusarium oxysporum f. sp. albedinis]